MKYKLTLLILSLLIIIVSTCKKGGYTAVETDTIQLTAEVTTIAPGGTTTINITGIQKNGHPMPDDTLVQLTVDTGALLNLVGEKVEAVLLVSGKAQVIFQADSSITGGTANITASSGTAKISPEKLVISISNVDVASLLIAADPTTISPGNSTSVITVTALDSDGTTLSGKSIALETTAGTLTPESPIVSDSSGRVNATLTTTAEATVKATYKAIEKSITVTVGTNQPPTAAFQFSPQNPVNGEAVTFISTSSDPDGTISHSWNFGDGSRTTGAKNPTHTFPIVAETKEFKVVLTVTDNNGASATAAQSVTVTVKGNVAPVAAFSFYPDSPDINEEIQFLDESTDEDGTVESYAWDFGDNAGTSTDKNPKYTYNPSEPTIYNVLLTVTDNNGKSGSIVKTVTVGTVNTAPVAGFTFSPEAPTEGSYVQFISSSTDAQDNISTYAWDFGDGDTSEEQNPRHLYNVAGSYAVVLKVTDSGGLSNSITQNIAITSLPLAASWTYSPLSPVAGEQVFFNSEASTGNIETYTWSFGDGDYSLRANPNHIFKNTEETTFKVTLEITDYNGNTAVKTLEILVGVAPTASFTVSPSSIDTSTNVAFDARGSTGKIENWAWSFGDGNTGSGVNVTHQFTSTGTYTVTLTVTDSNSRTATTTRSVTVN